VTTDWIDYRHSTSGNAEQALWMGTLLVRGVSEYRAVI